MLETLISVAVILAALVAVLWWADCHRGQRDEAARLANTSEVTRPY